MTRPTLKLGSKGAAVATLSGLLSRGLRAKGRRRLASFVLLPLRRRVFDRVTRTGVIAFQRDHHLEADGVVGPRTWAALVRYAPRSKRQRIVDWCNWALAHEPSIHYLQRRPMRLAQGVAKRLPLSCDCSESTTMAFRYAGAPDPNGRGYNGSGFTGTMRSHLRRKSLASVRAGDLIVYGPGTGAHVVVVLQGGADPVVFSHGQESGPRRYRHSVEARAHGGYFTCHDAGC